MKLSIEVYFKVEGGDGFAGLLILTSGISNYSFYSSICWGGSISNSTDFEDEWWSSSSFIIDFWGVSFKGNSWVKLSNFKIFYSLSKEDSIEYSDKFWSSSSDYSWFISSSTYSKELSS